MTSRRSPNSTKRPSKQGSESLKSDSNLVEMPPRGPLLARMEELEELNRLRGALSYRRARRKIDSFYPDEGPLRRELYPKHLQFFRAGSEHRERCFLAANRIGKTEGVGAYESALHLTGQYPKWWEGRKFTEPISAWAAGKDSKTVREIIQLKLLGPVGEFGTGMIPAEAIEGTTAKPGVPDAVESITVRHVSGGRSRMLLKSYDQGRDSFVGTEQHLVWLDEECNRDIYVECLTRTMTTDGLILLTFTPLLGMTDIVMDFLGVNLENAASQ